MCSSRLHSSFSGEITCKKQSKAKQHPLKSKPTKPPLIALVPIHYSPTHPQFLSFICDFNFPSNPSVNPSSISIQHLPLSIMDADSWAARLSSTSKRYQYALQSRSSDMFMGFEDIEVDDDIREEFPCPFCTGYFDVVGLCCHIDDEHHVEAKNGVCPICAVRVGVDMVAHITLQHGNIFKMQQKRKCRKGSSVSTLSLLRRELREGNLQSLFGGSSYIVPSANAAPDPLLSSFILPIVDDLGSTQSNSTAESVSVTKSTTEKVSERKAQSPPLSIEDKEERSRRSEFVQGMLMSTILGDEL